MMNWLWGGMLVISLVLGMLNGSAGAVVDAMLSGAADAVTLSVSLAGAYMFWMGLMKLGSEAGLIDGAARLCAPLLGRLFPDSGDALAPITLNLAANFFGMGSAATPFGLEAMKALGRSNKTPGRASDAMVMFLALNSSAIELLPTSVLALRTAFGSTDVYCVVVPTFLASIVSAVAAVLACFMLGRRGA